MRSEHMASELIPETVLSACDCICGFFPNHWSIEWVSETLQQRLEQAARIGISSADLPAVLSWATEAFSDSFGWPNAFYTLKAAQEVRQRFLPEGPEIVVFGLGLCDSDVERFLDAAAPPPQASGYAPVEES